MTPSARIEVNGREISTRFVDDRSGLLVSIVITDEAGGRADTVSITIDDRDAYISAAKGDEIRVWLGNEPTPVYMGRYTVENVRKTGPRRTMTVEAKAADLMGAIRAPKTRSWHEKTVGEIATTIAAEHGLKPAIAPDVASVAIPHIDQQTESDLSFLARLAMRVGVAFKVGDGGLLMAGKRAKLLPSGLAAPSATLRPEDVESWEWSTTGRGDYRAVACAYRDAATAERKTVTAGDAASPSKWRDRRFYASRSEAEAAARAQLGDFQRGKTTADIETALGLPAAFAESEIVLEGFDDEMDGAYRVSRVVHTLDGGGFRSSLALVSGYDADEIPVS